MARACNAYICCSTAATTISAICAVSHLVQQHYPIAAANHAAMYKQHGTYSRGRGGQET